ncbi:inositol monophosphatase family protein [Helicobacter canis]|uniref:Inositol monophosphatase family protein n=1 Tax=Helicobacter canis TaxID=29419 RepID=A0A377J290_9HELI|nr:inositol monophosphatase family protein [Helicobacter canis]STO96488.1 inositol monophosphatase family protein [Helicobacter canis]
MSEFLCALLQAAREIIPALATREAHLLQAGAKGAGGDISIGADLLCEAIFVKHLSHIAHIDSEESGFIPAGSQIDTNKDSRARAVDSMDCHADKSARNDKAAVDCHADKSARNDNENSVNKKVDSSTANLESTFDNAATLSTPQAAANEDSRINAQNASKLAKDSRINVATLSKAQEAANEDSGTSPSDSKIVELESGFFKLRVGDKTDGLSSSRGDEIHDSSPQAESPKQNEDSRAALTIVLDPLDGSDNYLSNIPYYGASLALCDSTGQVLEAAVVNFCSAQIIYGNRDTPNATRIHLFTQKHSPIAPTRAKCGIFEKAYSHPEIARELYAHKLKFRSLGASALSLAYALEHNFFLFCGAIRKYDALAGLFLCRDLAIARGADFLLVSQNKQDFGMIEQILYKHHTKHN